MEIDRIIDEINNPIINFENDLFGDDLFGLLSLGDGTVIIINDDVADALKRKRAVALMLMLNINDSKYYCYILFL